MNSDIAIAMFSVYTEHDTRRILLTSDVQLWLKELRENTVSYSDNRNSFNKGQQQLITQYGSKTVNNYYDEAGRRINVTNSKTESSHFPNSHDCEYLYKSDKFNVNINNVNCDKTDYKLNEYRTFPDNYNKVSEISKVHTNEYNSKKEEPIYENIWDYRSKNQEKASSSQIKLKSSFTESESKYIQSQNILGNSSFKSDHENYFQNSILERELTYESGKLYQPYKVNKTLNQIDGLIDNDSNIFYYENEYNSAMDQSISTRESMTGVTNNLSSINLIPKNSDICETNYKDKSLSYIAKNMDISHININSKTENTKPWKSFSNKSEMYNTKNIDNKNIDNYNSIIDEYRNLKSNSPKTHSEKETVITHNIHSKPSISNISSRIVNNNVKICQNVADVLLHNNDNKHVETNNYNNNENTSLENCTTVNNTISSNDDELYRENKKKPIATPRRNAPKRSSIKEEPIYVNLSVKPKVPPKINVTLVKSAESVDVCKTFSPSQVQSIRQQDSNEFLTLDCCNSSKQPTVTAKNINAVQKSSQEFLDVKKSNNSVNHLSSFKCEPKVSNVYFAKQEVDEGIVYERPISMADCLLINETNIASMTENIRPRKDSITSSVLTWACDLFENYESEPDYNKMEESEFQSPKEDVVDQSFSEEIYLRNSKLKYSERKFVKSAITDSLKSSKTDEHPISETELVIKKEGVLDQVKIIIENKKCKRWTNCYLLLTNHSLYVFKDKEDVNKMKSGAKGQYDHVKLDLKKCTTKSEHSHKKNVFVIINDVQTQVFIQSDIISWKILIEEIIASSTPNLQNTSSVEDLNKSGSVKEQSKIKDKLKNFFGSTRTPVEDLTKRGIYKDEAIFSTYLERLCANQSKPKVPEFVKKCIKAIEPHLDSDGLYRASGNLSQVQKIRLQVDQNDFSNVNAEKTDIHVLTGALKLFFRELRVPLIPNDYYDKCIEACNKDKSKQASALNSVMNHLPIAHRDTLQYLMSHLIDVSKYESSNRMDISNLATVWAPNILQGTMNNLKQDMLYHCTMQMRVVEIMLTQYSAVFGCKKEDFAKKCASK